MSCPRDRVWVTLFTAVMRYEKKKRLREGGFILARSLRRVQSIMGRGERGTATGVWGYWLHHTQAGSRWCWMLVLSLLSHFIKSRSLVHGLMLPTVGASPPSLVKSLWTSLETHLDVCCHDDKSSRVDNEDLSSHLGVLIFLSDLSKHQIYWPKVCMASGHTLGIKKQQTLNLSSASISQLF